MKLLIINQYFPPDRAATGLLLGQLTEDLQKEFEITVLCGQPTYAPEEESPDRFKDVTIHRTPLIKIGRKHLPIRLLNYALYILFTFAHVLRTDKHDVVMTWTDPPIVGLFGIFAKRLHHSRFIFVSQDVYPELLQAFKKLDYPWLVWILQKLTKKILHDADEVVSIGDDMKQVLIRKGTPKKKIHVIYNWQDVANLKETPGKIFREMHHIPKDTFLVMHSGNIGWSQDFDSLLKAAEELKDNEDIRFAIVGDGARLDELRTRAIQKKLQNVLFLPYQPGDQLDESLSAANLHYVSLKPELVGLIVPSKIYGIMAVSRPILLNVPQASDTHRAVLDAECGIASTPQTLAKDIQALANDPNRCKNMGQHARHWVERHGSRSGSVGDYKRLIWELLAS